MANEAHEFILNRIRNYLRQKLSEGLAGSGVKVSNVPILRIAASQPGLSITETARIAGMDKSTATRNVQQLVDLGYVDREGDPCKANSVYLTDEGRKISELVNRIQDEVFDDLVDGMSTEEKTELIRLVGMVSKNLSDKGF